jgi:methylthioribose-1-phosphate isomerase
MIPTIEWKNDHIRMIDQRKLPLKREWYICRSPKDVIDAIKKMVIRGAPAIGIAAAMGMALSAKRAPSGSYSRFVQYIKKTAKAFIDSRPTAYNIRWAVERMLTLAKEMESKPVKKIKIAMKDEAFQILKEDIEINKRMGQYGQGLIPDGATVLTHCNAGALATGGYGTALGVIRAAVEAGKRIKVIADETRPWLQGLRLTAFELMEDGIPVTVIADSSAGFLMRRGEIDIVITGADRIAANGDTANKIGTYQVAVLAKENRIPFYIAAPLSTIDPSLRSGDQITIEFRDPDEIKRVGRKVIVPSNVKALNPAFDITPNKYITGIVTEKGIIHPPYRSRIKKIFSQS